MSAEEGAPPSPATPAVASVGRCFWWEFDRGLFQELERGRQLELPFDRAGDDAREPRHALPVPAPRPSNRMHRGDVGRVPADQARGEDPRALEHRVRRGI
jgi:hypothetical protein